MKEILIESIIFMDEKKKLVVHLRAGKIGRGFIAELLHDSGYKIVFGDVVDELVE